MQNLPFHILRIGIGLTFVWIGFLILKNPESWAGLIQSWVISLLSISPLNLIWGVGVFDIAIGSFLLLNYQVKIASFLAALHLFLILLVSGINTITVRNIGLLAGSLALLLSNFSQKKL
ncbi:MAG: hypothetical protein AAB565_02310 [Patescibacteria group bacterium]